MPLNSPILGFDARFAPVNPLLLDDTDPTYAGVQAGSREAALRMLMAANPTGQPTAANYSPQFNSGPALVSGPQQSYTMASNIPVRGEGQSGQAGQMQSSYNNSPYTPGPQGTIGNTGAPQAQGQNELAGQGGRGLAQYQSTPSWTGSPLSQSPEARTEDDFKAPPISGPQNPLLERQAAIRQLILQHAMANMPRGYQFKLG